ncbi:MAG: sugar ABC transporter permease [Oscillospiraceae bacterium]
MFAVIEKKAIGAQTSRVKLRKRGSLKKQEARIGWLFVSPALIGFTIFTFASIIRSLYYSFTEWDLLTDPKLVGFKNFVKIFQDKYFYQYMGNTFYFVIFLVPIVLVISLLLSIVINKKSKGIVKAYRAALFLPSITSTVAISMVWLWIFNPDMGILNNFLYAIGFNEAPAWLNSAEWSKPALVIMRVWQMSGYYMIMFLAGLQTIPDSLYEASEVDGANKIKQFFKITVPLLSNTFFVVAILLIIEAFNMFESIFIMTGGGPLGSTSTIMYYIYEKAFSYYEMGYASALAWIFFIIIMIVTLIQYRFRNEQGGE